MATAIHGNAAELILASIWTKPGKGYPSMFPIRKPGEQRSFGGIIASIYFSRRELIRACLYVRKNGPAFLSYISVGDIWSMLTKFVQSSYWTISSETFMARYENSYAHHLSGEAKARFAEALSTSPIFAPVNELSLFPLVPVEVKAGFSSSVFFLGAPSDLKKEVVPALQRYLLPDQFPPFMDMKMKVEAATAWLGVRSPNSHVADKMRSVILGALALTPNYNERHMFSMRHMYGGVCTAKDGVSVSFGAEHTPAMMHNIRVTAADHAWLSKVSDMLQSNDRAVRRQRHALEYFYRSWPLKDAERFPILCMALDALFGDANQATQAVIDGVRQTIGEHVEDARLRLLMQLRASVVHGGAPDVYDSSKYARYYDRYDADPIKDLELVVALCLQTLIFGGLLVEHDDPNAALIEQLKAQKRIPDEPEEHDILAAGKLSEQAAETT